VNCYDYFTEEEREFVEENGCFDCTDCEIPYRRALVEEKKQHRTNDHDRIVEIHTTLLGQNGQGGLTRAVEAISKDVLENKRNIQKLWIAIAVIVTSMGGGIYGVVKLLGG